MTEQLLSPMFLFRFAVPCRRAPAAWPSSPHSSLGPEFTLPNFGVLEGRPAIADVRMAWTADGIGWEVRVSGKSQAPWARDSRVEDSDGLHVWIDTRDSHNIHRASRFCHRFSFLPAGGGKRLDQPIAAFLAINRARELPRPVDPKTLLVSSAVASDGYAMRCFVPASALTGFDSQEHPRLGFTYSLIDRERGWQSFNMGPEFPFAEDPSLWGTVELVP